MKTKLLFFIAFFAICSFGTANAQFNLKPYIGINSSKLTNDFQDEEFKAGIGYQIGVDLLIGRRIYIQPGLNYEFARVGVVGPGDIPDLKISRINLPLFFGIKMFREDMDKYFDVRAFTGPSASIIANFQGGSGLGVSSSEVQNFNLAWNAGLGVDIFMFFVDIGYKWDINNFFKSGNDSDASQNVFYANAGLRFTF